MKTKHGFNSELLYNLIGDPFKKQTGVTLTGMEMEKLKILMPKTVLVYWQPMEEMMEQIRQKQNEKRN